MLTYPATRMSPLPQPIRSKPGTAAHTHTPERAHHVPGSQYCNFNLCLMASALRYFVGICAPSVSSGAELLSGSFRHRIWVSGFPNRRRLSVHRNFPATRSLSLRLERLRAVVPDARRQRTGTYPGLYSGPFGCVQLRLCASLSSRIPNPVRASPPGIGFRREKPLFRTESPSNLSHSARLPGLFAWRLHTPFEVYGSCEDLPEFLRIRPWRARPPHTDAFLRTVLRVSGPVLWCGMRVPTTLLRHVPAVDACVQPPAVCAGSRR